jgi:transcriptional regulator with XRE-family HTH domain
MSFRTSRDLVNSFHASPLKNGWNVGPSHANEPNSPGMPPFPTIFRNEVAMSDKKLGERIRAYRERQDITLEALASRTGLTEDFLTALEEDDVTPSLGPLLKIALALGQRLGTFMDDAVDADMCLARQADRDQDDAVLRKARGKRASFHYHSLGATKTDRHMEPFFIEIYPDEEACAEKPLSSHEGEEFIVVVSGELEVIIGPDHHVLGPGDSIYYNSVVPHYVGCGNAPKTDIYAVLFFPHS